MNEHADLVAGRYMTGARDLAGEFEARLADSGSLAVRVAFSVLRHREDAEDVALEAFIRAHRRFAGLRDRDRFRAWLVRMTWRLALDWQRGARRRAAREQTVARLTPSAGDAERDLVATDRSRRLWAAIDELPEKLRIVTVLAAIEGHGLGEVAGLLGIPEGTVKSRLFEARRQLQERLQ
jgi:RNA polymerase sigma-70 factor (ECF subfamily)